MKTTFFAALFLIAILPLSFAADFSPTLLKISAAESIHYNFDGEPLNIPVRVEGQHTGLVLSIFTRDNAEGIRNVINGYLGWHYVNRVDTCIYFSPVKDVQIGQTVMTWDGRDEQGELYPNEYYTYYIWAFDSQGSKQIMTTMANAEPLFDYTTAIQEVDEAGLPLANPIWYTADNRWIIGSDPADETQLITTSIKLLDGWHYRGDPLLKADDFNNFYISVADSSRGSIMKVKFVPDGEAEIDPDWGEDAPYASIYTSHDGASAGVASDGRYLFTTEADTLGASGQADFFIYDMDGYMIVTIDLSPWWSSENDADSGGFLNAGPINFEARNSYVILNSHASCLNQMIHPSRYLESEKLLDLFVWSNGNGDYMLDKNFEETASNSWLCNDNSTGPMKGSIGTDNNLFTAVTDHGAGIVSFGLLAPDGTGLGYHSVAGQTANDIMTGVKIIDSNTPFDGMYCNTRPMTKTICESNDAPKKRHIAFLGHDSITGTIERGGDCFQWPDPVILTLPLEKEKIVSGENFDISWSMGIKCGLPYTVFIEYSLNNGETWETIAAGVSLFAASYTWKVPEVESNSCLLRIMSGKDYTLLDETDEPFAIVSGDVAVASHTPHSFTLSQNSPNPFNPVTSIPFTLGSESLVSLSVYNIAGEVVAEVAEGRFTAGAHNVNWNASEFASGVYFYRIVADDFIETRKMMLVK